MYQNVLCTERNDCNKRTENDQERSWCARIRFCAFLHERTHYYSPKIQDGERPRAAILKIVLGRCFVYLRLFGFVERRLSYRLRYTCCWSSWNTMLLFADNVIIGLCFANAHFQPWQNICIFMKRKGYEWQHTNTTRVNEHLGSVHQASATDRRVGGRRKVHVLLASQRHSKSVDSRHNFAVHYR